MYFVKTAQETEAFFQAFPGTVNSTAQTSAKSLLAHSTACALGTPLAFITEDEPERLLKIFDNIYQT